MSTVPIPSINDPSPPTPTFSSEGQQHATTMEGRTVDLDDDLHDPSTLSPLRDTFPRHSVGSPRAATFRMGLSHQRSIDGFGLSPDSANDLDGRLRGSPTSKKGADAVVNPFNFQTIEYTVGKPPMSPTKQTEFGRRRGHRYARSSVSHQIILEPAPRTTPLQLPASLPIPTFKEFRSSMTREQTLRWLWCLTHLLVASYIQYHAHGSLSMTALSHLLFFDTLGAVLCVAVDIGKNFEVWQRSSIRHPFGLERAEVLAGFATAIILLFMGCDLISHGLTHSLESKGGHEPHHSHQHERVSPGSVDIAALAAILSTIISAASLGNRARIGRSLRLNFPSWLPSALHNPSHLLTLSCSGLLLLLPLLSLKVYGWFDAGLALTMALAMILLGGRLCLSLGRMLLMSFPASAASPTNQAFVPTTPLSATSPLSPLKSLTSHFPSTGTQQSLLASLVSSLAALPGIVAVNDAKIWQVHYGLCVAAFKVEIERSMDPAVVKDRVDNQVRGKLAGGYGEGRGLVKWETSVMCYSSGALINGEGATAFGEAFHS